MVGFVVVFLIFFGLFLLLPLIGLYIVNSLSIMKVARKLGHPHPGYAFIPFYCDFMNGKLMEDASRRNGVKPRRYAGKLLTGTILMTLGLAIFLGAYFTFIAVILNVAEPHSAGPHDDVSASAAAPAPARFEQLGLDDVDDVFDFFFDDPDQESEYEIPSSSAVSALAFGLLMIPGDFLLLAGAIISGIYSGLGWWQLYRCFDESHALLFLMLSLFCSISFVFYFIISGKEPKPDPDFHDYGEVYIPQ